MSLMDVWFVWPATFELTNAEWEHQIKYENSSHGRHSFSAHEYYNG